MSTNRPLSRIGGGRPSQLFGNRRTSILVAVVSALLAAGLIYAFVSHYKSGKTVAPPPPEQTVFVAKSYIALGTPYQQIISQGLLQRETVPAKQAVPGAITDPSVISGQVASQAVAAGQQVAVSDFSTTAKPTITSYLAGDQRAVGFSLDAEHGLTAFLQAGMYVDIMGQKGTVSQLLAPNVEVIGNSGGQVIMRLTDKQALLLTAATGKFSLWLTLRPTHGATQSIKLGDMETL